MKMEQTECSETSAYKIQTPGNYPEENIQHTEHGESLKSRISRFIHQEVRNYEYNVCVQEDQMVGVHKDRAFGEQLKPTAINSHENGQKFIRRNFIIQKLLHSICIATRMDKSS
jgi:hypothetical protein